MAGELEHLGRPVEMRASRRAISVASVPELTKRTFSAEATSFWTHSPHSISSS